MNISVPDELFASPAPAPERVMLEIAVVLVCNYWVTPSAAAGVAGRTECELLQLLTDRRITTRYNADEVRNAVEEMRRSFW